MRGGAGALASYVGQRPWLRLTLIGGTAALAMLAAAGGAAWQTCGFAGCPDAARLASYRPGGAPLLLDRHGQVIAALVPDESSQVRLSALPAHVAQAFIAIEDRRFFEHGAVDWRRALGALAVNLRARAVEQGFSTLSMQLARNVFPEEIPGRQRTASRKLIEIRVAQQLEARFSKPEILELYLNHIYFGNGARGIEAAAWQYFGEPAAHLTLAQAALLAALPKAPTRYDPRRHADHALARRNLVLACMAAQGRISASRAAAAEREPLGVHPPPERQAGQPAVAAYFADEVRHQLDERFGESLYDQPVRVWTTLDLRIQRAAEEEMNQQLRAIEARAAGRRSHGRQAGRAGDGKDGGGDASASGDAGDRLEGAVVTLAAASGDVLAWVGGRDGDTTHFDRVANARRQVGSAWKPFVYAAALAHGIPLSQPIADTPLTVPLAGGGSWEPRNYDGAFDGQVTLREALVRSKNIPTVRLSQAIGYGVIAQLAASDGIPSDGPIVPSMALGTVAASPLKLTAAYTAFANLGWRAAPRLLLRIDRADGTPLWTAPEPARRQVLDPAVAYLLDDALRDVLQRGSGAPGLPPSLTGRAGGKTGTSTGGNDVWFVGFTSEIVTGVWIGFDEPRPVANQATGGRLAAPVFRRLMARIYAGRPAPAWPAMPGGVQSVAIDPDSGLELASGCASLDGGPARQELFLTGHEPHSICPGDAVAGSSQVTVVPAAMRVPAGGGDDETPDPRDMQPVLDPTGATQTAGAAAARARTGAETEAGAALAARPAAGAGLATPNGIDIGGSGGGTANVDRGGAGATAGDGAAAGTDPGSAAPAAGAATRGGAAAGGAAAGGAGGAGAGGAGAGGAGAGGGSAAAGAGATAAGGATGVSPSVANVSGWWTVVTTADESPAAAAGGRKTYLVALRQQGSELTGRGECWEVDGRQLAAGSRGHVDLTGTVQGRDIRLRFTERGTETPVTGTILYHLAPGGQDLSGTFTAGDGDAHGVAAATRLR